MTSRGRRTPGRPAGPGAHEWVEWHRAYATDPGRQRRLAAVREEIRRFLATAAPGRVRVVSACAGDGRDLLGVLANHPRAGDVDARLVELDPELVRQGRATVRRLGLSRVRFRQGDAGLVASYRGAVPADLVLLCGVFGNVSDADLRATVGRLPELCGRHATVVWTRGRFEPDLTPSIRAWFAESGVEEVRFRVFRGTAHSVGTGRFVGIPRPIGGPPRLFTFLPHDQRPSAIAKRRAAAGPRDRAGGRPRLRRPTPPTLSLRRRRGAKHTR